jgi:hypothetical protein
MRVTLFEGCEEGGETITSGVFAVDVTELDFKITFEDFDRFFYFLLQIRGWRWVVGGWNKSTIGWGWARRFGVRWVKYHGWRWKRTLETDGGRTGVLVGQIQNCVSSWLLLLIKEIYI